MPPLQLTEDARQMLMAYTWPGNVRQLKNITEQISIIEANREINADILKNYLNEQEIDEYKNSNSKIFSITVYAEKGENCCDPNSGCC